ncbi:MAG: hypothetical protein R2813_10060 [Flavobacteriales bacterium]
MKAEIKPLLAIAHMSLFSSGLPPSLRFGVDQPLAENACLPVGRESSLTRFAHLSFSFLRLDYFASLIGPAISLEGNQA